MNIQQLYQKFTHHIKLAFTFLVLQLIVVTNVQAIKLTLNGQPSDQDILNLSNNITQLNISQTTSVNELLSYKYSSGFKPVIFKTDIPYLCIGRNNDSPTVSLGMSLQNDLIESDPFKIRGYVSISSMEYDYNFVAIEDKTIALTTTDKSQCVVKGNEINSQNPNTIFLNSFESSAFNIKLEILQSDLNGGQTLGRNVTLTNGASFSFKYKITNLGSEIAIVDFADYYKTGHSNNPYSVDEPRFLYMPNTPDVNNTWTCNSTGSSHCGDEGVNTDQPMITGSDIVYLKNAKIAVGQSIVIAVTRLPVVSADTMSKIEMLASALVINGIDSDKSDNSDTRSFNASTNSIPTISTVAEQTILEDSAGIANLDFTVFDIETPLANLVVTATSSDQSIVSDANITIINGATGTDRKVSVVSNLDANTAAGPVIIILKVEDANGGINTSNFNLNITPINDKPTFTVPTIADYLAGTMGNQGISNFIQNVVFGPTTDENSQMLLGNPIISNVSDTNGVLNSAILPLGAAIVLNLSGQGGTVTFDVQIQDDGTIAKGGLDTSDPVSVSFTVLNTLPTISMVADTSVDEDNMTSTLAFTVSDAETLAGDLTMSALSSDTSIVPISGIQFGGSGGSRTVQIMPALNQNTDGISPVTITLIVNDGSDTKQTFFDLSINPINDAPTFSLGADLNHVASDAGFQQLLNFATALSMGPTGDEDLNQNIMNYNIQVTDSSSIFDQSTVVLDIINSGTLQYVLSGNVGTATIVVSLQDDGGVASGGVDTSATQTFTITVQ